MVTIKPLPPLIFNSPRGLSGGKEFLRPSSGPCALSLSRFARRLSDPGARACRPARHDRRKRLPPTLDHGGRNIWWSGRWGADKSGHLQPRASLRGLLRGITRKRPQNGCFLRHLAEEAGFEPAIRFPVYTLSRRAPSTTRPPLRAGFRPRRSLQTRAHYIQTPASCKCFRAADRSIRQNPLAGRRGQARLPRV